MSAVERLQLSISRALQLGKDCGSVFKWALVSRLCVFVLQVVSNLLIPDHVGSMEDVFMKVHRHPPHDAITEALLGGFDNWDSEYFIYIAQHGYTFLQAMAFFPLYPALMWLVGRVLLFPLGFILAERSLFLLAGVLINFTLFPLAAIALYLLTMFVSGNQRLSILTALLFCINPASVFMSAVYTECLFALCTFSGLCLLTKKFCWTASVVFALAVATRSNGIVLSGFIAYHHCRDLYSGLSIKKGTLSQAVHFTFGKALVAVLQGAVVVLPFALFQVYGYWKYCSLHNTSSDGTTEAPFEWCQWTFPTPYFYIQEHYWNVGFLKYFQLKQIPNFLLALPVVCLSVSALWNYFVGGKWGLPLLGPVGILRPYIFHFLFLLLFGTLNMHVQVLTRFLCSSSPVLYWFAAVTVSQALLVPSTRVSSSHLLQGLYSTLFSQYSTPAEDSTSTFITKLTVFYFLAYVILGCVFHCNFYPWT